jgi:thymidylate kinase
MPQPVLVTISGMVGAGKSHGEGHLVRLLRGEGVQAGSWRFRTLPCFTFRFGAAAHDPSESRRQRDARAPVRGRGYKRRPLTFGATAAYLGRMAAFRVYRRWRQPAGWTICNRYFYDNLAHFDLDAPTAQKYVAVLRRFMPRPDLAIMFVASPAVIAERRPQYSTEYLEPVWQAYSSLAARFPEVVIVNSDPGGHGLETVDQMIAGLLRRG